MSLFDDYEDEEEFGNDELDEDELEPDDSDDDLDFASAETENELVAAVGLDDEDDDWGLDDPEEIEDDDWEDDG